jgi:paraquat-inducible protein B
MSEPASAPPEAQVHARRWFAWVWAVPIVSAMLVAWLAWHALADRGPAITISFKAAQGLQPGQTRIQHRSVDVGTVESVELTPDMSRVLVHARMTRAVAPYLTDATRFYIVVPRVGFGGISGLTTIVSGVYIEMYPDSKGEPQSEFTGLDEPRLAPDAPGTSFVLRSPDLGSVTAGAPITYSGVDVGEVEGYSLASDGQAVSLTAFVRAPYDRLVHPQSRFWNVSGLEVSIGAQGVHLRAGPWQELLIGGVAFETPKEALWSAPSPAGEEFSLYANREAAVRALRGPGLQYIADFVGKVRGIGLGSPVELQGTEVGEVDQARLRYDSAHHALVTQVTFSIDPAKVQIEGMPGVAGASREQQVAGWVTQLVRHGLRAQVSEVSLLTGSKLIALDMVRGLAPGRIERSGDLILIPTAPPADLSDLLASARDLVSNLKHATAGPELRSSLRSLDHILAQLDTLTRSTGPDLKALVLSLRQAADAAGGTLANVQTLMGSGVPGNSDLPRLLDEVTRAARAVRELADFLDQHPEALLLGRGRDTP